MKSSRIRKHLLWLRFVFPLTVFSLGMFLLYVYLSHSFFPLFYNGYWKTTILIWAVVSFLLICWVAALMILLVSDPGSMKSELRHRKKIPACRKKCQICGFPKPIRVHHCRTCGYCFARMDHHCDAIGVCVALRNHKVFLLFILYGTILVFIYGGTALALIPVLPFQTFPYHLVLDGFIGGSLGILASWLFTVQMRNILIGKTSIELEFKIDFKDEFTPWQRLVQVMGPFSVKWFIPIPLEYDLGDPFQWEVPETELSEEEEKQKVE